MLTRAHTPSDQQQSRATLSCDPATASLRNSDVEAELHNAHVKT